MTFVLKEKVKIGISACNFGAMVRWNRKGWDRIAKLGREKESFLWTPVCPEVEAGLGVGRSPVRLVGGNGNDFWNKKARMKNREGRDVSDNMRSGSLACFAALERAGVEAFVFMEGSPTCGVYRTTLKNKRLGKPPGVFGSLLLKGNLFLIPAQDLDSPIKWWDWRRRLHAFAWLKRAELSSKQEIVEMWQHFKFLCQEVDVERANEIGQKIANLKGKMNEIFIETLRKEILLLLRKPSNIKRINSALNKHLAHYRNHFKESDDPEIPMPDPNKGKAFYLQQLLELEKVAYKKNFVFGGTPVIYRGR